jgi:uncharacterized protein YprB with RNaseH-like and TPR domain
LISTLILDLETTDLDADRAVILCASYKSSMGGGVKTIRQDETNPLWSKGIRGDDKELVKQVNALVREHDVIVAHNGSRFDIPMLRTRALRWRLAPLREVKLVDPCTIAFRKFKLASNRLDRIADYAGVEAQKTPVSMSVWADAMLNGSKRAMNYIVEHCEADIKVLEGVLDVVKPFIKVLDDRGSAL